jgi:hypothetical protein
MIVSFSHAQQKMAGKSSALHPDLLDSTYLKRYAWPHSYLQDRLPTAAKIIVVIPCYQEPDILRTFQSLEACTGHRGNVAVLVVVNHGEHESEAIKAYNVQSCEALEVWMKAKRKLQYHLIRAFDLPSKKAGVGLARKIGMDEAVRTFHAFHEQKGIIVCLDADCTCSRNYFYEIERAYKENPSTNAALMYFEHNISDAANEKNRRAIIDYELHLRYYVQGLKHANFPLAYHTVGSCITVSAAAYEKHGGMNMRKAGEDFYFLQKILPLGHIVNVVNATVYPSSRPSYRVPFGTGKAVGELLKSKDQAYLTYHPQTFDDLRMLVAKMRAVYHEGLTESFFGELPESISTYIKSIDFMAQTAKIIQNSSSRQHFERSFYNWFNGSKVLNPT